MGSPRVFDGAQLRHHLKNLLGSSMIGAFPNADGVDILVVHGRGTQVRRLLDEHLPGEQRAVEALNPTC